ARQPGAFLYLIADPSGRIVFGNVAELEPGVLDRTGWTVRPFWYRRFGENENNAGNSGETASEEFQALAEVIRIPNQLILLVGRDLGEPERFRDIVRRSLFLALGIMVIGGFLIWFLVGRRALRRIDSINEASLRIVAGDASGRLPVSGAGDEFDRLSENLNGLLDRIARLDEGLREVSANIAHDLRTPLTRLRNRAEEALSRQSSTEDYRTALEAVIGEADQLIRTFNAILMISRLEAGSSGEPLVRLELDAILRDVVDLYEPLAEEE